MRRRKSPDLAATRIVGALPLKVTRKVTEQIIRSVHRQVAEAGRDVTARSIGFIPSSKTTTETGAFQVVANTVIDVLAGDGASPRVEALDSVITIGRSEGGQTLEGLTIPSLQHVTA